MFFRAKRPRSPQALHSNSTLWLKEKAEGLRATLSACIKLGVTGRLSPHQDAADGFCSGMQPMVILVATPVVPTAHPLPTQTDTTASPSHPATASLLLLLILLT